MSEFTRKEEIEQALTVLGRQMALAYAADMTFRFIDRLDLIALKLFAAMDPAKGRRHESDLIEIKPSKPEMAHAVNRLLGWKSNAEFKKRLAFLVSGFGFPALAATTFRQSA